MMSELKNPGNEREQPQMSSISRYYADIRGANGSYGTIVAATDTMLENLPIQTHLRLESFVADESLPSQWQVENEPRIATEKLAMLPLKHFGPQLDVSDCSIDEIMQWYDDAIKGVRSLTDNDHGTDCMTNEKTQQTMCSKSTVCPQQFMQRYFSNNVAYPDFNDLMYVFDPKRGYSIAYEKCNLAAKHNVIAKDDVAALVCGYTNAYIEHFNDDEII